jgi:hypothetical protein
VFPPLYISVTYFGRSDLIGLTFSSYAQSLEEIQDYCQENMVPHIVMLKDIETGTLRVRSWEKERLVVTESCQIFALKHFTLYFNNISFFMQHFSCILLDTPQR